MMDQCSIFLRKMKKRTWCLNTVFFQTGKKNKEFFSPPIIITKAKTSDFHCDLGGMTQCTQAVEFTNLASHLFVFLIFVGSIISGSQKLYVRLGINFQFLSVCFLIWLGSGDFFRNGWELMTSLSVWFFRFVSVFGPRGPFQLRLLFYYMFILLYIFHQN
jgi:hypothetical protein